MYNKKILSFYIKKINNDNNITDSSLNIYYNCIKEYEYKYEYDKYFKNIYNYNDDVYDYSTINWGSILWIFLHTITFKIKEEFFEEFKIQLISKIKYFLKILPCNMCLTHTNEYFEKNPIVVNTKNDLILALYNFHNNVNNETQKQFFSYSDFYEKYNNINLFFAINNFLYILELYNITNSEKFEIQEWLSSNIDYFDK